MNEQPKPRRRLRLVLALTGVLLAALLAYLAPGRYAEVRDTLAFPFHAGWSR